MKVEGELVHAVWSLAHQAMIAYTEEGSQRIVTETELIGSSFGNVRFTVDGTILQQG